MAKFAAYGYVEIARILRLSLAENPTHRRAIERVIYTFADELSLDHGPGFARTLFLQNCGIVASPHNTGDSNGDSNN